MPNFCMSLVCVDSSRFAAVESVAFTPTTKQSRLCSTVCAYAEHEGGAESNISDITVERSFLLGRKTLNVVQLKKPTTNATRASSIKS